MTSFPKPGAHVRISSGGGQSPRWSADGRELFFLTPGNTLMSAVLRPQGGAALDIRPATRLFDVPSRVFGSDLAQGQSASYDVRGDRFLFLVEGKAQDRHPLTLVTNWTAALDRGDDVLVVLLKILLAVLAPPRAQRLRCRPLLVPHLAPAPRGGGGAPFVSIVVPARDEERAIEAATRSKCLQADPAFEVVVVDDRSSDGTRGILRRLERGAAGRASVVDGVEPPPDWLGKPHALDEGARAARRDAPARLARLLGRGRVSSSRTCSPGSSRTRNDTASSFWALLPNPGIENLRREAHGARPFPSAAFCYFPGWLMNVPSARALRRRGRDLQPDQAGSLRPDRRPRGSEGLGRG